MNPLEQHIYDGIDEEIKKYTEGVSLSFKQNLGLQQSHLHSLYGDRGDFLHNLERYESFADANLDIEGARTISSIDDVPELTIDQLMKWIEDEEYYTKLLEEIIAALNIFNQLPDSQDDENTIKQKNEQLLRCLDLLGVAPEKSDLTFKGAPALPFYEWIVDRTGVTAADIADMCKRISNDRNLSGSLRLLGAGFASFFTPGMTYTYDNLTVVTQQPRKFYYRGENAFYGSSRPGLFRGRTKPMSPDEKAIARLRMHECGLFLENFDAVRFWKPGNGTVRYGALMQHYGLKTCFMDITSDLKTALFFACCRTLEDDPERWRPLTEDEIVEKDSRNDVAALGGDSRYGIIYRDRTEIEYMRYFLGKNREGKIEYPFTDRYHEDIAEEIIPIGYQPFMRCSTQHGYALMEPDESYDMYKDPRFGKYRIRLTEDLCKWIFDEMDGGSKVYPNNDIPHIQRYISKINSTREFSREAVDMLTEDSKTIWTERSAKAGIRHYMKDHHYKVMNRTTLIRKAEIDEINKTYSLEEAEKHLDVTPVGKPMMVILGK